MLTKTLKIRPRRCTSEELKKIGVVLIDDHEIRLGCKKCGQEWSPNLRHDGRLPHRYWKCPEGRNHQP